MSQCAKSRSDRKQSPKKQASQAMSARGASDSVENARKEHLAKGDAFLKHVADCEETAALATRWGQRWRDLPEKEATQREVYEHLANYLADVHIIPAGEKNGGQKLGEGTALATWRGLLNERRVHFSNSTEPATKVNLAQRALRFLMAEISWIMKLWAGLFS